VETWNWGHGPTVDEGGRENLRDPHSFGVEGGRKEKGGWREIDAHWFKIFNFISLWKISVNNLINTWR